MSGWEIYDDEAKLERRIDVGFRINFISMNNLLIQLDQQTGAADEKYPKSELIKLWVSTMIMQTVLLCISTNILLIISLPFLFFYFLVWKNILKTWKRFNYKKSEYILMTLAALVVMAAITYLVHLKLYPVVNTLLH